MGTINIGDGKEYYSSIDGLRVLACFGIILMHIQANTNYNITDNFIFDQIIPSFTSFVYLFLMISGFGMCVGYLKKFQNGKINLEEFYKKRYLKILPFFGLLLGIALLVEHNLSTLYESSIELLLLHGLLPNNAVSVIGVSWTLGVIFLFYLLFPAFSVLLKSKKRAWMSLAISIWIVYVCDNYFFSEYFVSESFTPRHNFLFCLPMFIGGGIIYLYRKEIKEICKHYRWIVLGINITVSIVWYLLPNNPSFIFYLWTFLLYCMWLLYAVGVQSKFLSSKPMKYLSEISMEMYLAQMIIFRIVQNANMLYIFGNSGGGAWMSFFVSFFEIVLGLIIFIYGYKLLMRLINSKIDKWHKYIFNIRKLTNESK